MWYYCIVILKQTVITKIKNKMGLVKTIKNGNKMMNLFNTPILGSEKVKMGNSVFYMMVEDLSLKVNRHRTNDSIIPTKVCGNCGVKKSVDYFYSDSYSRDGYHLRCKCCNDKINK
jgi:hypothetical protein|tara:strand:+ start:608 stop:955 length:348 start_codon:yes stop_codon:yes gene_type:complete